MCLAESCDCYCYQHLPAEHHSNIGQWYTCPNCAASVRVIAVKMDTRIGPIDGTRYEYAGMDGSLF